jgi:hypothetical protein
VDWPPIRIIALLAAISFGNLLVFDHLRARRERPDEDAGTPPEHSGLPTGNRDLHR